MGDSMTVASKYGGMGARLFGNECSFRVWAPNARKVRVEGDFTGWAASAIDLFDEGNGNWSVDVSPVAAGQMYKYLIDNAGGSENDDSQTWERADARALQVENSGGAAAGYVLAPVPANRWSPFQTPRFENFILHAVHHGKIPACPIVIPEQMQHTVNRVQQHLAFRLDPAGSRLPPRLRNVHVHLTLVLIDRKR